MPYETDEKMVWPGHITDCLSVNLELPLIQATIKRVSDEVFTRGRGNIDFEPTGKCWLAHLTLTDQDRHVAVPFLIGVTDVWIGINQKLED